VGWTVATPLGAIVAAETVRATGWDHPAFLALVVACCTFVRNMVFWLSMHAAQPSSFFGALALQSAMWSAALNAVVALLVMLAFAKLRPLYVRDR
jgi:hypothetical protein